MLREGFHRSFEELCSILQRFEEIRQAGGPDKPLWYLPSLQEQPDKLQTMRTHLTRAETAFRAGNFAQVYEEQLALAQYFTGPEEDWISLHFYREALSSAQKVKTDGGRKEAEANAILARVYLQQGQLDLAMEHYEVFHHLSLERPWWDASGRTLHHCACEGLCAVYIQLAQGALQSQEHEHAIDILNKALDIAKKGNTVLGDNESQSRAFKAVAKSLESEGKLAEAVQHLEKFAEISRNQDQQENLEEACMSTGIIYSKRGEYERGVEYLQQAYDIARSMRDVGWLQRAQVCVGVASAQRMLSSFSAHISSGNHNNVQLISTWKDSRQNAFDHSTAEKK
ncbi:hypothetical protein ACEWY4_025097 [Coilia grayii]|uniref:Tetratricopeptide repeat protein 29 n=1 Tax=Coilia grayii TaxID=363190 RepID=A0ABD1J0E5_9TELE